jgi:Resolvase, N terminal domain
MRRAVLYLRVSTVDQTTSNQERELREIAGRMGCEIVKVYRDHGIRGAGAIPQAADTRRSHHGLARRATANRLLTYLKATLNSGAGCASRRCADRNRM